MTRTPRTLLGIALLWLIGGAYDATAEGARRDDSRPPDIFVYMIDTLRADELPTYGSAITKTPTIDSIAEQGVVFEHAYAVSSATRPSIASFLTGVLPIAHGAENLDTWLSPATHSFRRLPEMLKESGYYTLAVIANPNAGRALGFALGFDDFLALHTQRKRTKRPTSSDLIANADAVGRRIIEKMKAAPKDKPLFLFALVIDPHAPYMPPEAYETLYDARAKGARDGSMRAVVTFDRNLEEGKPVNPSKIRALYRGEITFVDHELGEIVGWLDKSGRLERTVLVVTADHGEEFVDHRGRGHGKTLYEEVVRVPLIIRAPDAFRGGKKRRENVDLLDLSSTLLHIAGIDPPDHWRGRDLRGRIAPRPIGMSLRDRDRDLFSLRVGRHKAIVDFKNKKTRLYDLHTDPREASPLPLDKMNETMTKVLSSLHQARKAAFNLRGRLLKGSVAVDDSEEVDPELIEALESLGYTR